LNFYVFLDSILILKFFILLLSPLFLFYRAIKKKSIEIWILNIFQYKEIEMLSTNLLHAFKSYHVYVCTTGIWILHIYGLIFDFEFWTNFSFLLYFSTMVKTKDIECYSWAYASLSACWMHSTWLLTLFFIKLKFCKGTSSLVIQIQPVVK
jgi:hypothetical protein